MARALESYVRALLAGRRAPSVQDAGPNVARAFGDARGLHIPVTFPRYGTGRAGQARFAAAGHLAAHLRFGRGRFPRGSLRPIQVVLVSLFEDARVELRAARELPGLSRTWASFHGATPGDHATFPALCARMSRALLDAGYEDPHPLVVKARELFFHADHRLDTTEGCRSMGSLLGNDVGQTRLSFDARTYQVEPPYRDDHRLLWEEADRPDDHLAEREDAWEVSLARPADGPTSPGSDRAPDEEPAGRGRSKQVATAPANTDLAGARTAASKYPEWDYLIGVARAGWCTLQEQEATPFSAAMPSDRGDPSPGGPSPGGPSLEPASDPLMRRLVGTLKLEAPFRRKRSRDGDQLDLDAAVEWQVDRRARQTPDLRVYTRLDRRRRELAAVLLLDVSASTGASVHHQGSGGERGGGETAGTVLDLARRTAAILGDFLSQTGDPFAIHGFSSNGRHQVEYHRFKDLDQPWDQTVRRRLAAVEPRLSTRMGPAIRHAGRSLRHVRSDRRLILLLTDGEPADVDAPDPAYLMHDARHAVDEQRRAGIHTFAVSLDTAGESYCRRIFGAGGYWIVDRPSRLPETLPRLYARLSR